MIFCLSTALLQHVNLSLERDIKNYYNFFEGFKTMKKAFSVLLVLSMLFSIFAVAANAESTVTPNGSTFYVETTEVVSSDLKDAASSLFSDYKSLANSWVSSNKKPKGAIILSTTVESTVDESTVSFVLDGTTVLGGDEIVTVLPGQHTVTISFSFHSVYTFKKLIGSTKGEGDFTYSGSKTFTVNVCAKTYMSLETTKLSFVYGEELVANDIIAMLSPSVTLKDGTPVEVAEGEITIAEKIKNLDAGKYTITIKYAGKDFGDNTGLQPCETTATLTITKAPASIEVTSSAVTYDGKEHKVEVTTTPENIPYTAITAGIQGDASGFASIYMSESNTIYNALVFLRDSGDTLKLIGKLLGFDISDFIIGSEGVTLAQLRDLITNLANAKDLLKYAGIDLDDTQISGLLDAISAVEKYLPDINVRFYVKNMPKNQGVYVTYAVTSDSNYITAVDFGFTTIAPEFNVKINWNENIYEWAKTNKNYDGFNFTATATDAENGETLKADIQYKITGMTYAGKVFNSNDLKNYPTEPGVYTETAYSLFNYIGVASRTFTIDRHETAVKFVDAEGNLVDKLSIHVSYDSNPVPVSAVVIDENGNVIDGLPVIMTYSGKTFSGKAYLSNKAPSNSGNYIATATFAGNGYYSDSAKSGAVIDIDKIAATITFANITSKILKDVDYSTVSYTYEGITAEQAARIAATLSCNDNIHLLIGTHNMKVVIPEDIAAEYDVTVLGGKHTVKLF